MDSIKRRNSAAQSSPINSLPYELLADIMLLALVMPRFNKWGILTPPPPQEVLVLCRICSHWRRVALNSPSLWAVETLPVIPRRKQMSLTATKMFLERSEPLPISVSIDVLMNLLESPDLLPMLVRAARRWKTLQLEHFDAAYFLIDLLATIPEDTLEHLEKLQMTFVEVHSELDVFLSAPRLRDVTLDLRRTPSIFPMPWAQLTRLSLEHDSPQLCLDILVRCTNLVSAHIATEQWLGSVDVSSIAGTGVLEQMEQLDISMRIRSTGDHIHPFLQRLELPALKSLSLALTIARGNFEWSVSGIGIVSTMIPFVARSPNLQCLHLSDVLNVKDLQNVLQYWPALVELSLGDNFVDDDFFVALTDWETEATPLVPKLETLHLTNVVAVFNEKSMREMIRSRWWSDDELLAMPDPPRVARLKRLKFLNQISPKYFTEQFREKMKTWRSQGLELEGF